ncbi:MAG: adenylate kinase, partial [Bacteroidia bacterium]|nr:adenylate kinase [Bacteroidia bacterium]
MLNLVLFGPPGAGKGTQSEKLIGHYHLVHLSTGDILRQEVASCTALGIEAKKVMDQGMLVPDEVVIRMIESRVEANLTGRGFIFDGFPRTIAQALSLDKMLSEKETSITCMLALEVEDEELIRRLLNRGKESGRSDDKSEAVIRKRIAEYNSNTSPLIDYFKKKNKFRGVLGVVSVDEIFTNL